MLHANFDTRGNCSETYNDIVCRLIYALGDVGVQVYGVSFDGDEVSVILFCNEFYKGVIAELGS